MKKKIVIGVIVLVVLFVIADYFGLILSIYKDGGVAVPFKFQVVDLKGNSVNNVTLSVFLGSSDLGGRFEYNKNDPSSILGGVGIGAGWKQTILFKKPNPNREVNKREIKFVFKHPDYFKQEQIFLVRNLKGKAHTIVLQPKEQADE